MNLKDYSKLFIAVCVLFTSQAQSNWIYSPLQTKNLLKVRYFDGILGYSDYDIESVSCTFVRFDITTGKPSVTIIPAIDGCRDFDFFIDSKTGNQYIYTLENAQLRIRKRNVLSIQSFQEVTNFTPVIVSGYRNVTLSFVADRFHKFLYISGRSNMIRVDINDLEKPLVTGSATFPGDGGPPYIGAIVGENLHMASKSGMLIYNIAQNTISLSRNLTVNTESGFLRSVFKYGKYAIYTADGLHNCIYTLDTTNGFSMKKFDYGFLGLNGGIVGGRVVNELIVFTMRTDNRLLFLTAGVDGSLRRIGNTEPIQSFLSQKDDVTDIDWINDKIVLSAGNKLAFNSINSVFQTTDYQKYTEGSYPTDPLFQNPIRIAAPSSISINPSSNSQFKIAIWDDVTNYTSISINVKVKPQLETFLTLSFVRGSTVVAITDVTQFTLADINNGYFQLSRNENIVGGTNSFVDFEASDDRSGYVQQRLTVSYTSNGDIVPKVDTTVPQKILTSSVTGAAIGAFICCYLITIFLAYVGRRFMRKRKDHVLARQATQTITPQASQIFPGSSNNSLHFTTQYRDNTLQSMTRPTETTVNWPSIDRRKNVDYTGYSQRGR